jgi:AbiV
MVIAAMPFGGRALAAQFAAMPPSQIAGKPDDAQVLAQDVDRLKQRGLYDDIDRDGQVRLPSEVSEADIAAQLGRARRAVSAASLLFDPGMRGPRTSGAGPVRYAGGTALITGRPVGMASAR